MGTMTFAEFEAQFLENCRARRQKPRELKSKASILRVHVMPRFGGRRLDSLTAADVAAFQASLSGLAAKTANNVLSVLKTLLTCAEEKGLVAAVPTIRLFKTIKPRMQFHEQEDVSQLIAAASSLADPRPLLVVLLGVDAGFRIGEIAALDWGCVDLRHRELHVELSRSQGLESAPKSNENRIVPMSDRLHAALAKLFLDKRRPRRGGVLWRDDGGVVADQSVYTFLHHAQDAAGWPRVRRTHINRHTFGTLLALRGHSVRTIQGLLGHASLRTTERYMHLSQTDARKAIKSLEDPA